MSKDSRASKLTFPEMERIKLLIRKNTELEKGSWEEDGVDRTLRYRDGWSDQKIAKEVGQASGREIGEVAVAIFRRRYMGELVKGRHLLGGLPPVGLGRVPAGVAEMRSRIDDLEESQRRLWDVVRKLANNERVDPTVMAEMTDGGAARQPHAAAE